ncbi:MULTISPECIES: 50S ribosomal protein L17 [Sporolactobacillus]|uniref:Large ribosomal subunit protein bL17 n=1 Tax=Sporolactobacillus nakayamae TaxID=269670 RepID=A0A1I2V4P8_9BACL|nr:50S ribosomal protein L17 [Sporolactobacillus nakayamae]SFG82236.1 LSU ribosomal protein L17P [Sporolactobacillus nakayamae]
MAYAKLGRDSAARKALFRDLATDLIINERIQTTHSKAKALRPIVEKMITLAKRGDLHARRQVAAFVRNEIVDLEAAKEERQDAVQKLFDDVAKRYAERQGGYTRILKVGPRKGDGAEMAIIELVK